VFIPLFTNFTEATKTWIKLDFYSGGKEFIILTPWRLGGFGDFRKKKQQFSVALPTP